MKLWTAFFAAALTTCMVITATAPAVARPATHHQPTFAAVAEPSFEPPVELVEAPEPKPEPEAMADERPVDEPVVEIVETACEPTYEPATETTPRGTYNGDFRSAGVVYDGGLRYTWYSQNVLPGGGLDIPGRHVGEGGYVMDGDGNIVVASSDLPYGTEVDTPFGHAVVYDSGCASGTVDVYVGW